MFLCSPLSVTCQQEVTVGDQTVVNVALQTDVQALDEVVVIGYGTVKKSDSHRVGDGSKLKGF